MPSAFKLFGEIDVKTLSFQGALRDLDTRLKSTAASVTDVEKKAKSLGVTSATSARTIEKLDDKISGLRSDQDSVTKAFDRGDISAKKYAASLLSIDKAAQSVTSRVKDINARLTDQAPSVAKLAGLDKIQELRAGLRDTFSGASVGANLAATKARELYTELKGIQLLASQTTRPAALKAIGDEADRVQAEIDQLEAKIARVTRSRQTTAARSALTPEQKYGRINLARQGADVFTQAGSGASAAIIAIQQGPQILEALAQSGIKASSVMGAVSTGFLAVASSAAVAGAAIVYVTHQIRENAERQLKLVERTQGLINKTALSWKKNREEAQKTLDAFDERQSDKAFQKRIEGSDIEALDRQLAALEKLKELSRDPDVEADKKKQEAYAKQIVAIKEQKVALQELKKEQESDAFEKRWDDWKKSQEDAANAAIEAQEKYQEALKETNEKLDEMQKKAISVVDEIGARQDNPILKTMLEAEKAIQSVTEATKGFSQTIINGLTAAVTKANDLAKVSVQITNAVGQLDAKISAANLRAPTKEELEKSLQAKYGGVLAIDQSGNIFSRPGRSTNPDVINQFRNEALNAENAEKIQKQVELQQRLAGLKDLQFRFRGDDERQALVDKQIQGLAGQFSKDELGIDNREFIAQAFDRDVSRKAKLEASAQAFYDGKTAWQTNIADFIKAKKEEAKNSESGKLEITVTDGSGRVRGATTATPNDVAISMGLASGPGGLTSY